MTFFFFFFFFFAFQFLGNFCPKAAVLQARNQVDWSVTVSLPNIPILSYPCGARWKCGARPLSAANGCGVKKSANAWPRLHFLAFYAELVGGDSPSMSKLIVSRTRHPAFGCSLGLKRRESSVQTRQLQSSRSRCPSATSGMMSVVRGLRGQWLDGK